MLDSQPSTELRRLNDPARHRYQFPTVREIAPVPVPRADGPPTRPAVDADAALAAREAERRRLSRDLHDGLGAALAGIILVVGAARRTATGRTAEVLASVEDELAGAVVEMRRLIDDLRPAELDELGLAEALERTGARLGLEVGVRGELDASVAPVVELAAFRIAGEALTNAARHGGASRCDVTVAVRGGELRITVADDGSGVHASRAGGLGMTSMRERAAELGGRCAWRVMRGQGTLVEIRLPLEP